MITVTREHEIAIGHRVCGHEGKCRHLHGHNLKVAFTCEAETGLDAVGRVIDFSVIKARLCEWLEDHWDHRMLLWEHDPMLPALRDLDPTVVSLPLNPTSENLADLLINAVGPTQLDGTDVRLIAVTVHETSKCSASIIVAR